MELLRPAAASSALGRRLPWILVLLAASLYYAPLLWAPTAVVTSHDNLDSVVVYNRILSQWLLGRPGADHLSLGGHLPIWALPGISQPLTYLYVLGDPWHAYLLTDVLVRAVAFIGAILLCRALGVDLALSLLGALLYSLSLSYTSYGLTVAGLPLAAYLCMRPPEALRARVLALAVLFFIGWSSALALSGLFFVGALVPLLRFGLGQEVRKWTFAGLFVYSLGLLLGSAGVLYAQLSSSVEWHRLEFGSPYQLGLSDLRMFAFNLASIADWTPIFAWYHVSYPLNLWLVAAAAVALLTQESRRHGFMLIGALGFTAVLYSIVNTPAIEEVRTVMGGLLRTFQFDRVYFLYSLLALCLFIVAAQAVGARRKWLIGACVVQGLVLAYLTPHWRAVVDGARAEAASFDSYYHRRWFAAANPVLAQSTVLSVGLDPMAAPMNLVSSLDGYYVMYPLAYKHRFMDVIQRSLPESGRTLYYRNWGNRVYAFHSPRRPESIDFCAAHRLGARHVVSSTLISSPHLRQVPVDDPDKLVLYEIRCPHGDLLAPAA